MARVPSPPGQESRGDQPGRLEPRRRIERTGRGGVELSVANSLWAKLGVDFNKEFLSRNKRFYGAEIQSIAFNDPRAAARINGWVALKTKDRIKSIVDSDRPAEHSLHHQRHLFQGDVDEGVRPEAHAGIELLSVAARREEGAHDAPDRRVPLSRGETASRRRACPTATDG